MHNQRIKSALPRSIAAFAATVGVVLTAGSFVLAGLLNRLTTAAVGVAHDLSAGGEDALAGATGHGQVAAVAGSAGDRLAEQVLGSVGGQAQAFRWIAAVACVMSVAALLSAVGRRGASSWPARVWLATAVLVVLPAVVFPPWVVVGVPLAGGLGLSAGIHTLRRRRAGVPLGPQDRLA